MQTTLKNPEQLDLVTVDPTSNEYVLVISAMNDWDDSEEEQTLLLQKLNNYVNFALDGGLAAHFPQSKGKPVRIQIDSAARPPLNVDSVITQAQALLLKQNIRLCVNLISQ
ncbi:DUF6572 domain-containing protein [Burkholderia sp. LMG 32019]|uniref:DUF6572 domain-containing protein n=1 Tax=Burkholderia sp. LMG 32019 TaxID=3158173 RepID=UPI003C2C8FB6